MVTHSNINIKTSHGFAVDDLNEFMAAIDKLQSTTAEHLRDNIVTLTSKTDNFDEIIAVVKQHIVEGDATIEYSSLEYSVSPDGVKKITNISKDFVIVTPHHIFDNNVE